MKRIVTLSGLTAIVALVSFLAPRLGSIRSQEPLRKPFTATIVERQYDPQGREIYSEYALDAVRGDGSEVRMFRRHLPNQELFEPKWVLDLNAKRRVSVDPSTVSITTYLLSASVAAEYQAGDSSCVRAAENSSTARSVIMGMQVVRVTEDTPHGLNAVDHAERWLAPQLGCFPLKEIFTFGLVPAGAAQRSVREVLFITEGEPAASLFEIPGSYAERSPSQVSAEWTRRFPGHPAMSDESSAAADQAYQAAQRN